MQTQTGSMVEEKTVPFAKWSRILGQWGVEEGATANEERERERENGKKGGRRKVGKRVLCSAEAASRGVRERERESTARPGKSRTFRFLGGWTRRARVDIVLDR